MGLGLEQSIVNFMSVRKVQIFYAWDVPRDWVGVGVGILIITDPNIELVKESVHQFIGSTFGSLVHWSNLFIFFQKTTYSYIE